MYVYSGSVRRKVLLPSSESYLWLEINVLEASPAELSLLFVSHSCFLSIYLTLKMEAVSSSETLVNYRNALHHITGDSNRYEMPKSNKIDGPLEVGGAGIAQSV
jgi:hypothetical protein